MGIDVIRLGDVNKSMQAQIVTPPLADLSFRALTVPSPAMSIWLMTLPPEKAVFPWWNYERDMDEDVETLNRLWSITSAQSFFDCLFLSQLKRLSGPRLYAIFPGYVKNEGWDALKETDRVAFQKGQGCVYHLEGSFSKKLSINWVPFGQPQSIVKDPPFDALWRLFVANQPEDVSKSISFFSLSDESRLPEVVSLLIKDDDHRSEKLAGLVDWFGAYMSPLRETYSASAVIYTRQNEVLPYFSEFQKAFKETFQSVQSQLIKEPSPKTALKIISRQIAL